MAQRINTAGYTPEPDSAARLRAYCAKHGLVQLEAAARFGVRAPAFNLWINGKRPLTAQTTALLEALEKIDLLEEALAHAPSHAGSTPG